MEEAELISIVVPMYNEEGNVRPLYEAIVKEFDELWCTFELIFVDDGSRDESVATVKKLHDSDSRVKLVRLSRNFGHQVALTAGLEAARGAAVVMMDGDLQHPPALIPDMIARWKEGYDIVYTVREETEGAGFMKRFTAASFYGLINRLVDTHIVPNAADFRLMDRKALNCLNSLRERNRFIRGLVSWIGFKQYAMPYTAAKRHSGVTKYSFTKMFAFAVDGIASFSTLPLRFSAAIGFVAAISGLPYALWAIYLKLFTDQSVSGWASMVVAVLFLGGVQLMTLGVIGEYVGRIYEEVKGRPLYIASETVGFDHPQASTKSNHDHVVEPTTNRPTEIAAGAAHTQS